MEKYQFAKIIELPRCQVLVKRHIEPGNKEGDEPSFIVSISTIVANSRGITGIEAIAEFPDEEKMDRHFFGFGEEEARETMKELLMKVEEEMTKKNIKLKKPGSTWDTSI